MNGPTDKAKSKQILVELIGTRLPLMTNGNPGFVVLTNLGFKAMTKKAVLVGDKWIPISVMAYNSLGEILVKKWFAEKNGMLV